MGINSTFWKERHLSRRDLTTQIVHLTKPSIEEGTKHNSLINLLRILKSRTIFGSTTETGFIIGNTPAVCFQDIPLHYLEKNLKYEKHLRENSSNKKIRYSSTGLIFSKPYIYAKKGRPVIYESTQKAKRILPPSEYWRIVNFDLSDTKNIVDWTHEREWRIPGDFKFELKEVTIVVSSLFQFQKLKSILKNRQEKSGIDYLSEVKSVVTLDAQKLLR